ncbi:MAG: TetR/AcrR family transcriptional regulator [Bryobacteraceae bacterium]
MTMPENERSQRILARRTREKQELRQKILNAATELFAREGYEGVSIRKIADRIEYSPTTIYLHFKDKAELMGNICSDVFGALRQRMGEIAALGLTPLEQLRRSLRAYIEFGLEHPNHYIVLFCLPEPVELVQAMEAGGYSQDPGMACFDLLREGIALCMREGVIAEGDVEFTSQSTFLMLHGITGALITMRSFPWLEREALINSYMVRVMKSLGA